MTDEQIDNLCSEWLYVAPSRTYEEHRPFARAIEAAATAPLLERIAELGQLNAQIIEGKDWLGNFLGKKLAELEAKLAQRVPDGWALVPKEPTKAMLDAMVSSAWLPGCYRELLAAAPAAPEQQSEAEKLLDAAGLCRRCAAPKE